MTLAGCQPARSDIYEEVVNKELLNNLIAKADSTYPIEADSIGLLNNPLWVKGQKLFFSTPGKFSILWFDEQDRLSGLMEYENNQLKDSILFHANGQRMFSILIDKNGKASGPARYYYPDGRVSADGRFEDGEKRGIWRSFKTDGRLEETRDLDKKRIPKS
jgi:hypothetical protein